MSFSNYTAQAILNALFGKTSAFGALAAAPTIYVGLSSTTPGEDGSNITEPIGGSPTNGYARVQTAGSDWNAATLADPSVVTNANDIDFPAATDEWNGGSDMTYFVLWDAAAGSSPDNFLGAGLLSEAKPVGSGDTPSFGAGDLSCSLD